MLKLIAVLALVVGFIMLSSSPAPAQSGMNQTTMKLLVGDLLDQHLSPQINEVTPNVYTVSVSTSPANAATAAQVNTFATNRGVTARVTAVLFQ